MRACVDHVDVDGAGTIATPFDAVTIMSPELFTFNACEAFYTAYCARDGTAIEYFGDVRGGVRRSTMLTPRTPPEIAPAFDTFATIVDLHAVNSAADYASEAFVTSPFCNADALPPPEMLPELLTKPRH